MDSRSFVSVIGCGGRAKEATRGGLVVLVLVVVVAVTTEEKVER